MEIKASGTNAAIETKQNQNQKSQVQSDSNFAEELKDLGKKEKPESAENPEEIENTQLQSKDNQELLDIQNNNTKKSVENAIGDLNNVLSKLNQPEDNAFGLLKDIQKNTDIKDIKLGTINDNEQKDEGIDVINNDFNVENKNKLPEMMPNMNFGGDGQPFSSFMQNENKSAGEQKLSASAKDLAEEAAILSTMAENIAIANKANINQDEKTVIEEDGIKKIDTKTNMVKEVIVKYDTVVMNEADVQVFADLVEGKDVNMHNISSDNLQKSVQVSKTLSDMLAKAMEDNKPVRIEFDNGISVIIKISRDGKLSADFLPSTQVAEAYLKENLPLLKQRFEEQNLDYDELNQRERRNPDREQNRKKGRENE